MAGGGGKRVSRDYALERAVLPPLAGAALREWESRTVTTKSRVGGEPAAPLTVLNAGGVRVTLEYGTAVDELAALEAILGALRAYRVSSKIQPTVEQSQENET